MILKLLSVGVRGVRALGCLALKLRFLAFAHTWEERMYVASW